MSIKMLNNIITHKCNDASNECYKQDDVVRWCVCVRDDLFSIFDKLSTTDARMCH